MTGLSLIDDLKKLKEKLSNIDSDIRFQTKNISVRDSCWDEMQASMNTAIKDNKCKDDKVSFDVGGRKFTTTKETLLKAKNSLFEAIVLDKEIDLTKELFFDRNPDIFTYILNYLRTGNINYKQFNKAEKRILLEEARYYQIIDIISYLEERLKDIELVSFDFKGPYLFKGQVAGSNLLEDLKNENLEIGGICSTTPGEIVFTLNSDWEFAELDIGGFKGNTALWYPENGANAQIFTSEDKKDWKKVGKIPSGFGKEVKSVKIAKSLAKYIKFTSTTYLGIGYLKIKKIEDD